MYCAAHASLACLEILVHLNAAALPLNRCVVEVTIPESVWDKRFINPRPPDAKRIKAVVRARFTYDGRLLLP